MWKLISLLLIITFMITCGCPQPSSLSSRKHHAGVEKKRGESLAAPPAARIEPEQELKNQINHLLKQLGAEEFREREKAQEELNKLLRNGGGFVLESLQNAREMDEDPEVRERLKRILRPYDRWRITPAALDAIPEIVELLESVSRKGMPLIIEALRQLDVKETAGQVFIVRFMIRAFKDRKVQNAAVEIVVKMGTPAVEVLIGALKDEHHLVRHGAARALREIGDKRAFEPLTKVLDDTFWPVRHEAVLALGEMGSEKAINPLIRVLRNSGRPVLDAVLDALVKIGKPAVEPVIKLLKDSGWAARWQAAKMLGRLGDKRAVVPLIGVLNDDYKFIRKGAAQALGQIGDERAIGPLIELLKWRAPDDLKERLERIRDENAGRIYVESLKADHEFVRGPAAEALRKITKQDFGEDYEKWKEWFEKSKNK